MRPDLERHHRRSIRLSGYDYAQPGAYFVTLCIWQRESLLGEVVEGEVVLSEVGQIVQEEWLASPGIRREIQLDEFVVMPNHVHGIVWLTGDDTPGAVPVGATGRAVVGAHRVAPVGAHGDGPVGAHGDGPVGAHGDGPIGAHGDGPVGAHGRAPLQRPPRSLGSFIAGFKCAATGRANERRAAPGARLWQRNYYEHIIRDERELETIRHYIRANPANWALDRDNPANLRRLPAPARMEDYLADTREWGEADDGC